MSEDFTINVYGVENEHVTGILDRPTGTELFLFR